MEKSTSPTRIIRLGEVMGRTGLRRSAVYDQITKGSFPSQVLLGPRSVGWLEHEIDGWIASRIGASRKNYAG
jgi:prophage regulatory protein